MAYDASLFAMILFKSRRLGIRADASASGTAAPTGQDDLNLLLVFGRLTLIMALRQSELVALLIVAGGCIVLGMGMPTLPVCVTVAAIALPSMKGFGLEPLTAHMFVFFIAVASAITPPVAIAAYAAAAAAISGGKPVGTSIEASRIGVMVFIIPCAFAYNPLILTVPQAGAVFTWGSYLLLVAKLGLAIYVLGSALVRFDKRALSWPEVLGRLLASVLLFAPGAHTDIAGGLLALGLLGRHHPKRRQPDVAQAT